ncbi:MAG: PAS domain S-box protein [Syntrophaceae bacterium]|jgi:two-component system, cell cycle sensor histidine kinase and response regulator CckA|nr:PAS domain S-box protein [Syntrophaceae bacterium]
MKTCLIVDDVEQNVYMLDVLLRGNGYSTLTAGNGAEALEKARANPPDVAVTDLLMPVMDGFALCRAWKSDPQLCLIPLIVYTATYTDPKDEAFCLSLGADRFLVKPLEPETLLAELETVLEKKAADFCVSEKPCPSPDDHGFIFRHYEAIARKLEDKMQQLQEYNDRLTGEIAKREEIQRLLEKEKETLRKSEAKLKSIIAVAPVGICIMKNRVYQSANPYWCEKFGYSEESLIGGNTKMLYESEEEFERAGQELYANLLKNSIQSVETRLRRSDGVLRDVIITAAPLSSDDLSSGTVAIIEDITESKREKEALSKSEEQLSLVIDGVPALLAYIDADLRFVYTNKAYAKWYGKSKEELIGTRVADLLGPEAYNRALPYYLDALSGKDVTFENQVQKDGQERYVSVRIVPHRCDGAIAGFFGSIIDITERRLAEKSLKEAESLFSSFMDHVPAAVIIKDSDLKPIYVNRLFLDLFPAEEWMGKTSDEIFPPEIAGPMIANDRLALSKGFLRYEEEWKTIDGLNGFFETSKFRIEREGKTPFLGCIIVDITALRNSEKQRMDITRRLQRAEKMEALGTMAGGIAHDLNNVLGIMVGYSEMLLDDVGPSNSIRPHLTRIKEASERAAAIVQDMLTLARRTVPNLTVLNLNAIIKHCQNTPEFERLSSLCPHLRIETDCDDHLLNFLGSQIHLEKSIINLALNAVESMPHSGVLTIRTRNQYLDQPVSGYDEVKEGDYVILTVSDTGEGIAPENLHRIFEPFYTKKVMGRSGTGLGLAVVWGTVKDHNGYIDVQSECGIGTTFTLYFPVTRQEMAMENKSVTSEAYKGSGESILIVDDIPEQRELASSMLKRLNYETHIAASGEEAVEWVKNHKIDLVVLDMIMDPGIDGLETYRRLQEVNPKQKAIIVSGFSETDRVRTAQKLGAGAYVRKPYVLDKLASAVRKELDRI